MAKKEELKKSETPAPVKAVDYSALPEMVKIVCVKDSKHMKKGEQFSIGKLNAELLIEQGYVELA